MPKNSMVKMRHEELREVLYAILEEYADFCDKHQLRYYLFCGTLLGAVRHGDFIPWDDDIDVSMPRPDYEKFIELTKVSPWANYEVKQYVQPFIKMVDNRTMMIEDGIRTPWNSQSTFIDIFPIDGLPKHERSRAKHFKKLIRLNKYLQFSYLDPKSIPSGSAIKCIYRNLALTVFRMLGWRRFRDALNKLAKRFTYEESEQVSVCISGLAEKDMSLKHELENRVRIHFRRNDFWSQGDYKSSLEKKYGDFMTLPPEHERQPFHGEHYWKDGPYYG